MGQPSRPAQRQAMIRASIFSLLLLAAPGPALAEPDTAYPATFAKCGSAKRINCVVDGDTFWHRGAKIRIADINTAETSRAGCAFEAGLGARATLRLTQLLNAGPFALEQQGRGVDHYGRQLRIVTRGGKSPGNVWVAEGWGRDLDRSPP